MWLACGDARQANPVGGVEPLILRVGHHIQAHVYIQHCRLACDSRQHKETSVCVCACVCLLGDVWKAGGKRKEYGPWEAF